MLLQWCRACLRGWPLRAPLLSALVGCVGGGSVVCELELHRKTHLFLFSNETEKKPTMQVASRAFQRRSVHTVVFMRHG